MDDIKIIDLFFARSELAIEALDGKYGAICHNLSRSILKDQQDAEECVNDAYLGVWNAIPPHRPNPLVAFVCKIVRNISIMRYRANTALKRNSNYDSTMEELEDCLASSALVEDSLEEKELIAAIENFLRGLSQENRVIFLRRYWFSDSYVEIAARTGLTEKNVSVRLSRIRKQLQTHLAERGVFGLLTLAQKFSGALNEIDDKFIVEAIEYQHHKVKLSRGKSLLLIAVLIVGLTATVMAAHLLRIGDLLLFPKQRESGEYAQGEVVPKPCMIGLSGYMNTPEGQALSEWSAFLNQYDPDGTIASSLGNVIDESLQRYSGYTVYTKEMFDELEHIANKHSLKLHTKVYDLTIHPELLEPCSGYLGGTDGVATYMFDDGSFHVDGSANISNTEVLYQLQRCAKGTLNEVSLNVIDAMSYQEWQYQTSHGISATLAFGPGRALILGDLPDSFMTITILAGSTDGLTRDLLEELADSFDLSKLTPIVLPGSLYIPSP